MNLRARWQEPFQLEDDAPDSAHELFVPMMVRGELLGFLRCAPKRDRTPYAADEMAALSLLAHHAGLAFAWLGRAPIPRLDFALRCSARAIRGDGRPATLSLVESSSR